VVVLSLDLLDCSFVGSPDADQVLSLIG
jgi:hypothetical protein